LWGALCFEFEINQDDTIWYNNNQMTVDVVAHDLLKNRNRSLGGLLTSERAVYYVEILLHLLKFRDNHELEPLHDDVLAALYGETSRTAESQAEFNQDMRQILNWDLVTQRIEKERLRGYRDTRRRKFRYRISDDAASFMMWLESRRLDDLQPADDDARIQLSDVVANLREMERALNKVSADNVEYEEARAVFHNLSKASTTTDAVAKSLGDLNIRLLSFVGGTYDIPKAHQIINELHHFLNRFLHRIALLRTDIHPAIEKLEAARLSLRWIACAKVMAKEAAATQIIMRMRLIDHVTSLAQLDDFYSHGGRLEQLTSRVNRSAIHVWRRLESHLRELERRSHRLEDIRSRIQEMALLPPESVPHSWLLNIMQQGRMIGDMHEWDENFKAEPPQPAQSRHQVRTQTHIWLPERKPAGDSPVQSLEERRLEILAEWMRDRGIMPGYDGAVELSSGQFAEFDDFPHIMDVMRSGLLGGGKRLSKIGASAKSSDSPASVTVDESTLAFNEISLRKAGNDDDIG
jgi:hypothetical protein